MDIKEHREKLFSYLDDTLKRAEKKAKNNKTKNGDKLSWERIIIQAVNAYGKLLASEEIEQRVEALEEKLKDGVLIPKNEH